jgi:DNA segregation ATPase FtsK/SpoIIIE, S-DNA-T family
MAKSKAVQVSGWRVVAGFALLALCLFISLSLFSYDWRDVGRLHAPPNSPPTNLIGPAGAWLAYTCLTVLGIGAYLLPPWLFALGLMLILSKSKRLWPGIVWSLVALFAAVSLAELRASSWAGLCGSDRLNILPYTTGVYGVAFTRGVLVQWLSPVGAGILLLVAFLLALGMLVRTHTLLRGYEFVGGGWTRIAEHIRQIVAAHREARDRAREERAQRWQEEEEDRERQAGDVLRAAEEAEAVAEDVPPEDDEGREVEAVAEPQPKKPRRRKRRKAKGEYADPDRPFNDGTREYVLPPLRLLEPPPTARGRQVRVDTGSASRIITNTLAEFKIEARVVNHEVGPVVTRYELLPAPGIRVERIAGLSNNLALSLKATTVRVQAPIPGKGVVGVEVPNANAKLVSIREIMEGEEWQKDDWKLPLLLGKDVGGSDIVGDLTKMPHLLIAGATGSGKSVCINSILNGLLMTKTPDELRLILVDPKIVEFSGYSHLPHLVVPVINDPQKVALGLRWTIKEMERRYKMFGKAGVRNIEGFNNRGNRATETQQTLFGDPEEPQAEADALPATVPYIIIVIDELADLMLVDAAEIENCVARLANLSRAVGIHMIIATQRPSVNVITGTIKANFPSRIAFQVAQRTDSRTILDGMGAEKLLGRGDMLFMPPGVGKLVRAQGAMISDAEIQRVTRFIKDQVEPDYEVEIKQTLEKPVSSAQLEEGGGEDESMLDRAIDVIRDTRRASTSSLQRRLRIGYTRAARVMDVLEERGVIGPPRGSEPREILIDLDVDMPDTPPESPEDIGAEEEPVP